MLIAGRTKCGGCGETLYPDPYRSSIASWAGLFGLVLGGLYESLWFVFIGLAVMMFLRVKWTTFVSGGLHVYRTDTVNLITVITAALISSSFTVWAIFADPSHVPDPRFAFIAVTAVTTILAFGFSVHLYKKRKARGV